MLLEKLATRKKDELTVVDIVGAGLGLAPIVNTVKAKKGKKLRALGRTYAEQAAGVVPGYVLSSYAKNPSYVLSSHAKPSKAIVAGEVLSAIGPILGQLHATKALKRKDYFKKDK